MAPVNLNQLAFVKDEKVLCFHHEYLYEAKILDARHSVETDRKSPMQYRVHYKGWKNTWDDWVPQDRIRKLTDENKELKKELKKELEKDLDLVTKPKPSMASNKKKAVGSDLSSNRGSEERNGQKRGRDYELEKVRDPISFQTSQRSPSRHKRPRLDTPASPKPRSTGIRASDNEKTPRPKAVSNEHQQIAQNTRQVSAKYIAPSAGSKSSDPSFRNSPPRPGEPTPLWSPNKYRVAFQESDIYPRDPIDLINQQLIQQGVRGPKYHEAIERLGLYGPPSPSIQAPIPEGPTNSVTIADRFLLDLSKFKFKRPTAEQMAQYERKYLPSCTSTSHLWAISPIQYNEEDLLEDEYKLFGFNAPKRKLIGKSYDGSTGFDSTKSTKPTPRVSTRRSGKEKTKIPEVETAGPSKSRKIRPVSSPSESFDGSTGFDSTKSTKPTPRVSTRRSGKEKTKIPEVETAGPSKSRKIRPVSSPSEKSKPRRVASLSEKSKTKRAATPLPLIEQPNEENPEAIVAAPPAAPPVAPSLVSLAKTSTKRVASSLPPIGHSGTGNDPLTTGPPRTDKGTGKGKRAASVLPSIEQPETKKLERTSAVPPRSNSSPLSPAPSCPEDITIAEAAKLGLPTNHAAEKDNVSSAPKKPADNDKWNVSPTTGPTTGPTTSPTTRVSGSNKSKAAEIPLDDTPADHVQLAKEKRLPDITDFEYTDRPDFSQEKTFNQRPAVRINVPDHIKSILVDDWENVTKNLSLVPLPAEHPVNEIMSIYFEEEKGKRRLGSAEADLLEEVVAGVKEYFETCVGRILLYRFEREQYFEVRKLWVEGKGEWEGKNAGDVYGAEHLCRLFVSLPELIAQTNMDQQSVSRLREELHKLTQWIGKNSSRFFAGEYESATQEYIEKVRGS